MGAVSFLQVGRENSEELRDPGKIDRGDSLKVGDNAEQRR